MIVHPKPVSNPAHTTFSIHKVLKAGARRLLAKKKSAVFGRSSFLLVGAKSHQQSNCHHPGQGALLCPVPTAYTFYAHEATTVGASAAASRHDMRTGTFGDYLT
jgi:hypothetical protein